jgi:hypothetical protein
MYSMRCLNTLDDLAELLRGDGDELFVRWSRGPEADLTGPEAEHGSVDALTGVPLPGLSANSLRVEPWWGGRSRRLWVARRLFDYRHLRELHGPGVRPWVLAGQECGRGPDNEALVVCHRPIAWIGEPALEECERLVRSQRAQDWAPLHRQPVPGAD